MSTSATGGDHNVVGQAHCGNSPSRVGFFPPMTAPPTADELSAEDRHRVVLTRELADAAGVPLPDRYGYAASDAVVHAVVAICVAQPDDGKAVDEIGMANFVGDI